jgi:hypothetical protein
MQVSSRPFIISSSVRSRRLLLEAEGYCSKQKATAARAYLTCYFYIAILNLRQAIYTLAVMVWAKFRMENAEGRYVSVGMAVYKPGGPGLV